VIAGIDGGFSQNWSSPRAHEQVQRAELEAMAEGARLATKALWGEGGHGAVACRGALMRAGNSATAVGRSMI
jgi:hypothetical protein